MPRREDVEGSGVTDSSLNSVSRCSVEFKTPKSMIGLKRDNANAESGLTRPIQAVSINGLAIVDDLSRTRLLSVHFD